MAINSKVEWCDDTDNLWHGCTEVHAGCDNCYARVLSNRWGRHLWGNDVPRMAIKSVWDDMNRQQFLAKKAGVIRRVFVGSMMDIFEKPMPIMDNKGVLGTDAETNLPATTGHLRDVFFDNITKGIYPNLMFLLLTKRPSNINKYIPASWKTNPPANVMFGTSPVNQATADMLIPQLLQVNGKRFLSVEPQLGPIRFQSVPVSFGPIHWVIQGGESGHHKRPFEMAWADDMRQQCAAAGVPYFFKQIDKVQPIPEHMMVRQFPLNSL